MKLEIKNSNLDTKYKRESVFYEARKNGGTQASDEVLLKDKLQKITPKFALCQIMSIGGTNLQETKFRKCLSSSYPSSQSLILKFSVILTQCLDWTVMINKTLFLYIPNSFNLQQSEQYKNPDDLGSNQEALLKHLIVDEASLIP